MSAPFLNRRVKVTGTSKPELNNQEGRATSYNTETMRYTVLLDNGRTVALKVANLIPGPVEDEPRASGGFPGMSGMPDLSQYINMLPPWLSSKLMRGEVPSMDDLKRLLPPGITTLHIGLFAAAFVLMLFRAGLIKTILFFGLIGYIAYIGFQPYQNAGGGVSGVKSAFYAVGDHASNQIKSSTQQNIPSQLAAGAVLALLAAVVYFILFTGGSSSSSSSSSMGGSSSGYSSSSYSSYGGLSAEEAYDLGYQDGVAGKPNDWLSHSHATPSEYTPRPPPQMSSGSSGGGFSLGNMFSFGKLFTIAILGRQVYSLGSVPGGGFDINLAIANLRNQSMIQNAFLGLMVLRLFGLSPI